MTEYSSILPMLATTSAGILIGICMHRVFSARAYSKILNSAESGLLAGGDDLKLVMVVRTDLGMGKGKIAAQCAHAAVGCYKKAMKHQPTLLSQWEGLGQPKVVLKVDSEDALYELAEKAKLMGLVQTVIHDAGKTQIAAGSGTVVGLGPGPVKIINTISGHLKLM